MTDISIVIPIFNEEAAVPTLLEELDKFISQNSQFSFEVVFVDDGSKDKTVECLKKFKRKSQIIKLAKNFGSHAAIRAGVLHATGKCIVNIYADLQEPLEMIPVLYQKIKEGNHIVWAYREKVENSFSTRLFSGLFASLIRKFVDPRFPKNGLDFVMFDEKVKTEFNKNIESNSSFALQLFTMGFQQAFIPYTKKKRVIGKSKWTLGKKIKIIIDSLIAFSYTPIRFVTVMGFAFFLFGVAWTSYIIYRKLAIGDVPSGWPALVSILFLGFGVTNISLGIIAEYLWRTLDVSRKRPVFIVEDIVQINQN
jgi:glycosyltransferase involved in cell wall biosynthesis